MHSKIKEDCGVFGIYGHKDAARLTYLGLYALQHRGQESSGIAVFNKREIRCHRGMGLVSDIFNEENLKPLKGDMAIGHVRYSTTGPSIIKNAQPFLVEYSDGFVAVAHNGNLINTHSLRERLEKKGTIFQSSMDSEVIVHLLAREKGNFKKRLLSALKSIKGAFSLAILTQDQMVAARDPYGFRPLSIGRLDGAYVIASESCAFDLIQAEYIREVEPGEVLFINKRGLQSVKPFRKVAPAKCIFEFIYFSRPDSRMCGSSVYEVRKELGRQLAREHPVDADLVLPIPDSGNCAALGFAQESGIPFEMGIIRNHYIGRTFIQPSQKIRNLGVKIKLNPVREVVKGKKVVIVEDSIVRGTTSRVRMKTLREAGAREVHMRVSCPPLVSPCFFGIDFPTKEELIASSHSIEKIRRFIGLNSLAYLSIERMLEAMPVDKKSFCTACFTGNYPLRVERKRAKQRRMGWSRQ
ncbi:MAG: amidophosphoribosyltransferase [Candidatus Omnitrophica bacterium]|nr:amidophosphoribosyltransferase [Candidatus Omnitrophota bacterium]